MGVKLQLLLGFLLVCLSKCQKSQENLTTTTTTIPSPLHNDRSLNLIEKLPKTEPEIKIQAKNTQINSTLVENPEKTKNAQSRAINIEKYISPEFKNKIFPSTVNSDNEKFSDSNEKLSDFPEFDLTTPRTAFFDNKFTEAIQKLEQEFEANHDNNDHDHDDDDDEEDDEIIEHDHEFEENENLDHHFPKNITYKHTKIIKNNTADKNFGHNGVTVVQVRKIDIVSNFNDTQIYNYDSEKNNATTTTTIATSTTTTTSTTTPRTIDTTRKPIALTKPPANNNNHTDILNNKIETETIKAINFPSTETSIKKIEEAEKNDKSNAKSEENSVAETTDLTLEIDDGDRPDKVEIVTKEIQFQDIKSVTKAETEEPVTKVEETETTSVTVLPMDDPLTEVTTLTSTLVTTFENVTEFDTQATTVGFTEITTEMNFSEETVPEMLTDTTQTAKSPTKRDDVEAVTEIFTETATISANFSTDTTEEFTTEKREATTITFAEIETVLTTISEVPIIPRAKPIPITTTTEQSTPEQSTTEYSTTEHLTTEHLTTEHSPTEHSTTEHSTTEHSTTEHSTTEHSTTMQESVRTTLVENVENVKESLSPETVIPAEVITERTFPTHFTTLTPETTPRETSDDYITGTSSATDNITKDPDDSNKGKVAAIIISTVGAICLVLLTGLLYVMRKRQKRFNYMQNCRPVSLDDYSVDNVSVYNSVRRKGSFRQSKRSYGNPAFDDPNVVTHPLNFPALAKFSTNIDDMKAEFEDIPQISASAGELPEGCESKNRYANVIPLPETRVYLNHVEGQSNSDYINANYVTGPKDCRGYYIACQSPMQNTVDDFWRMVWEQNCKVILMITHLFENGVEKCADYLPPSEVLDRHRLFGDYQVTLKKRDVKEKYIISSLQLKNMVSNSWREITHFWYIGWPEKGVPSEANSLIAFLIEARSYMKSTTLDRKHSGTSNLSAQSNMEINPVVVHCSPGTGRTGVVIACDIAIREFEQTRLVDIPKVVYRIRRDRAGAVQTKEQYMFIYKVVSLYAAKLTGGALDSF